MFNKIKSHLTSLNVEFEHKEHEQTHTSEESARIRGDALSSGAKAIVYKVQDQFYLFVLAADRRLDSQKIKEYFKGQNMKAKKTRFATADELLEMTGLVPGSVPPFGKPILDFELFVDPSLMESETIAFNAGSLTNSISMKLEDYMNASNPVIFHFSLD